MPSKKPKLTQEMVAAARGTLDAIPSAPKELRPITISEAIRTLTPTIRRLRERGHSPEAILQFLREQGIECSLSTFKEFYRPGRGKNAAKPAANNGGEPATNGSPSIRATAGQPPAATSPPTSPTGMQPAATRLEMPPRTEEVRPACDTKAEVRPAGPPRPALPRAS